MKDMVTASESAPRPPRQQRRQQLLARYKAESLERMTAAQLRDAVDYLLAGLEATPAVALATDAPTTVVPATAAPATAAPVPAAPVPGAPMPATSDRTTADAPPLAALPARYDMETDLIGLGAALSEASRNFQQLERRFYLAAFGRYDD